MVNQRIRKDPFWYSQGHEDYRGALVVDQAIYELRASIVMSKPDTKRGGVP